MFPRNYLFQNEQSVTNDYGIVGFAVTSVLSLVGIVALKKKKD